MVVLICNGCIKSVGKYVDKKYNVIFICDNYLCYNNNSGVVGIALKYECPIILMPRDGFHGSINLGISM